MVLLNLLYKLHWGRDSKGKKGLVIGQVLLLGGPTQPSSFSKAKVNLLLIQDKTTRRAVCGERCSVFGMGTTASLRQGRCFCQRKWWENIYGRSVANRQDTNFSRIRDVAPIEHSLPEARGWLCTQRCAGGDARTSAGSSHVLRMMKFSSKQWQEVALMMLQG